jgi:tripartite-type tricarboxylate transporter receptor subunit TctC
MNVHASRCGAALALACCATLFAAIPAAAQEPFPSRPIQIVVAQAPRGAADLHARPLAQAMERILRQPVIVANKPGAGGVMGTQFVAASRADGYTLLMAMPGFFINPQVDILFDRPPKFKLDQFTPVARLSAEPLVLVVHPSRPWKSVADLVADVKRRPGDITYASSGIYAGLHFPMEIFASTTGIKLKHVPYNGAGPAVIALLGGHVDALATGVGTVLAHLKSGGLRALATSGDRRLAALPEISTLKELGVEVEYYLQVGIVAHRDTPALALKVLREAVKQAVRDPDFEAAMALLGTTVSYLDAGEYQDLWAKDSRSIAETLQQIGRIE